MEHYENVSFETPVTQVGAAGQYEQKEPSFLARLVIKFSGGKIENETQAQYALAAIGAIALIITVTILAKTFDSPDPPAPQDIIEIAS